MKLRRIDHLSLIAGLLLDAFQRSDGQVSFRMRNGDAPWLGRVPSWMWLPSWATSCQPSAFSAARMSRLFTVR